MDERDLPEGVIDADPPGGWESGKTADGETAERSSDAEGSAKLSESGADRARPADGDIESDVPTQVADPDLSPEGDD